MRSLAQSFIAVLLPVCILWLFVACVVSCGAHMEETRTELTLSESFAPDDAECCLMEGIQGLLTERINVDPPTSAKLVTNPIVGLVGEASGDSKSTLLRYHLFPSPPKLLKTLRI